MADIPKFGYPRRIDIVDAVNELGGAGCIWVGTFTYLI